MSDPRIAFACAWGPNRTSRWSGTPMRMFEALEAKTPLIDLDVRLPRAARDPLRVAYLRRSHDHWRSMWAHSPVTKALEARTLQSLVNDTSPDVVVEIQDLAVLDRPYFVVQDLSYDLLLDHFGARGVPHFRGLTRREIVRMRDRQCRVYEHATGLLPMSRWLADRCVQSGVEAARVHVIHPGTNAPLNHSIPIPQRRTSGVNRLLFIGRDFDTKGGAQVVAAFNLLRAELGDAVTLTIAGPATWPLNSPVPAGVEFLGPVPAASVQGLYDSHDLFVMPSHFEGFGIAFAEALTRGLPCVGRNACAMPEIIEPETGGRLVQSDSADELAHIIVDTLRDDDLYSRCAAAAPARTSHYGWDRAADQILTALRSC